MSYRMASQFDFMEWLEPDMALKILTYLDDSADLIRVAAVSRFLQNIVISNGLSKQLCIKRYPQLASITHTVESNNAIERLEGERNHRAYASLFHALTTFPPAYCIADPVSASSTDNYPEESIMNTLDPRDRIQHRDSYWSSKGSDDTKTPETLIYSLTANLCVIKEINLHPFRASFQLDFPIYSSKFVRFRMGHPKCMNVIDYDFLDAQECADDKFIWTYTSQVFPVAQENRLQRFELAEPVVCIGGYLQIELLGRAQQQAADGRYYICMAHVQAIGCHLSPAFCVEFSEPEPSQTVTLKYNPEEFVRAVENISSGHYNSLSTSLLPVNAPRQLAFGNLEDFIHIVQAQHGGVEYEWVGADEFDDDDDDDEDDDDNDEVNPGFLF